MKLSASPWHPQDEEEGGPSTKMRKRRRKVRATRRSRIRNIRPPPAPEVPHPRPEGVPPAPRFVDSLSPMPRQEEGRDRQDHVGNHMATQGSRCPRSARRSPPMSPIQ
jgi:hypothetical protein